MSTIAACTPAASDSPPTWRHKWGYRDTEFVVDPDGVVRLTGNRYELCGCPLPDLVAFTEKTFGISIDPFEFKPESLDKQISGPRINHSFYNEIQSSFLDDQFTLDDDVRLAHSHGQTSVSEIYRVVYDSLDKCVDMVFFPNSQDDVVQLVRLAVKHDVCLVPRGGGTNVSNALRLPDAEHRMVVSVNLQRMNKILWIDESNLVACIEAGITGSRIEEELGRRGFTMGHEPDSIEFSTLGGWIATNASGMKKNKYGNIEDIVLGMTMVSAAGVLEEPHAFGRISAGMRLSKALFGNEGNLGVVTKAVVRLHRRPEVRKYQSLVFETFDVGVDFLRNLRTRLPLPASIRLMDNQQVGFGVAFKPEATGLKRLLSRLEKIYITRIKGYHPDQFACATVVMEGGRSEIRQYERRLCRLARRYGAVVAGAAHGRRGYDLTFAIAYIRELFNKWYMLAETFETTVPWDRVTTLYERVKKHAIAKHEEFGLPGQPLICGRVSQVYPTEACLYFTYTVYTKGVPNAVDIFTAIEHSIREVILAEGGSISHHHGIGKLRQQWMDHVCDSQTASALHAVKRQVDATNVFGIRNNIFR